MSNQAEQALRRARRAIDRTVSTLARIPVVKALCAYEVAYNTLTDRKSVSTLSDLQSKFKNKHGIMSRIARKHIEKARQGLRPDLETPRKLKDDVVRRFIAEIAATDYESDLGTRINKLESDLRSALAPKTLREHIVRVAREGVDKNTIGDLFVALFDAAMNGGNVCCALRHEVIGEVNLSDEACFSIVPDEEGLPFMVVFSSLDSKRSEDAVGIVCPVSLVMKRLEQYEKLGGIALDPWDAERLWLPRKNILEAWGKYRDWKSRDCSHVPEDHI